MPIDSPKTFPWHLDDLKLLGHSLTNSPPPRDASHPEYQIRRTTEIAVVSDNRQRVIERLEFRLPPLSEVGLKSLQGDQRLISLGLFMRNGPVPDLKATLNGGTDLVVLGRHERGVAMAFLFAAAFTSASKLCDDDRYDSGFLGLDKLPKAKRKQVGRDLQTLFSALTPNVETLLNFMRLDSDDQVVRLANMELFEERLVLALSAVHLLAAAELSAGDWAVADVEYSEPIRNPDGRARRVPAPAQGVSVLVDFRLEGERRAWSIPFHLVRVLVRLTGLTPIAVSRPEPAAEHTASLHHVLTAPPGCHIEDLFWQRSEEEATAAPTPYQRGTNASLSTNQADLRVLDKQIWWGLMAARSTTLAIGALVSALLAFQLHRLAGLAKLELESEQVAMLVSGGAVMTSVLRQLSESVARRVARIPWLLTALSVAAPISVAMQSTFPTLSDDQAASALSPAAALLAVTSWMLTGLVLFRRLRRAGFEGQWTLSRLWYYRVRDAIALVWTIGGLLLGASVSGVI